MLFRRLAVRGDGFRRSFRAANVLIRPVAEAPSDESPECWRISEDETLHSMRVVAEDSINMTTPVGVVLEKAAFAETVEAKGGMPTGPSST